MVFNIETQLESQVKDHEIRIKQLEESDLKQQIQFANIEKSQAEIKVMITENNRDNQRTLNEFTQKILETFTTNINNDNIAKNEVKFYNTKQFWAILTTIMTVLGSVITYYINK